MLTSPVTEAASSSLPISSEVWEKVVSFPPDSSQEDDHLENLIVATTLIFKNAGLNRKSINLGLYCLPTDGSSSVSLMTPLRLAPEDDRLLVTAPHTS